MSRVLENDDSHGCSDQLCRFWRWPIKTEVAHIAIVTDQSVEIATLGPWKNKDSSTEQQSVKRIRTWTEQRQSHRAQRP